METTNKKECPKCHSGEVFETRSGVGSDKSDKSDGTYTFNPLSEVFCECKKCGEKFSYKKII